MKLIDLAALRERQIIARLLFLFGIILPLGAQTWTPTSAPVWWWYSIACSADGSNVVASEGNLVYFSTNSGLTWNPVNAPDGWCWNLASSADGKRIFAVGSAQYGGLSRIWSWASDNSTWIPTGSEETNWQALACSADGMKVIAGTGKGWSAPPGYIYVSTDAGTNWLRTSAPAANWHCVASSAAATVLVAAADSGPVYISTNSGSTWLPTASPPLHWASLACSASGSTITGIGLYPNTICTSTNSGASWSVFTDPDVYSLFAGVASSAVGEKLVALAASGQRYGSSIAYFSTNSGLNWLSSTCPGNTNICSVASSADGNKVFAAMAIAGIFVAETSPAPLLNLAPSQGDLKISWTIPSLTLQLQQSASPTLSSWGDLNVPATPDYTNLEMHVTVPRNAGEGFFRLISK